VCPNTNPAMPLAQCIARQLDTMRSRRVQAVWPALSAYDCTGSSSCRLSDLLRSLFAVNSTGNAHVVGRMLKQENIDDLRIGSDGFVSDLNDVADQLSLASLREAGGDRKSTRLNSS